MSDGPARGTAAHDELIAQFIGATGADAEDANYFLSTNHWDAQAAIGAFEGDGENELEDPSNEGTAPPGGGRTLGDSGPSSSAQGAAGSGQPSEPSRPPKKFATLGDLAPAPHVSDDDSEEDQDLFAGGEKSGLAVQNPDDLKKKIIEKARKGAPRAGDEAPAPQQSNFRGPAQTLGGDDAPSQRIEAEPSSSDSRPERVERRLHFWSNGFSVDDGELHDTSVPHNAEILNMIRSGRAPLHIMNVRQDQEVDVKVEPHEGPYVAPKRKYKPFSGSGQRLGSPTPGLSGSAQATTGSVAVPSSTVPASASSSAPANVEVDSSQPTLSLQIRLGDGSRLVSRFNTTHTIGDVYSFVQGSSPDSASRQWVLMTTFPSKELADKSLALSNTELKKGGTVVQKWT